MAYKYESILKTFEYSRENYQIISDFLLSGDITNPDIKLKVNTITKNFRPKLTPQEWFKLPSTKAFISALLNIQLESNSKKLKSIINEWLVSENIDKSVFKAINGKSINGKKESKKLNLELISEKENGKLMKLLKSVNLAITKRGGNDKSLTGTWIHRDLAVKYAEWLDPIFSIWISQKIQELVNDGVSWNEIRAVTKMDYKPLTDAVKENIIPKYPKMQENIVYGKIANYINLRVMGQKAKDIREDKKIADDELTRDYFKKLELKQIEKVQVFAEMLITQFEIYDFPTLEEKIMKFKFHS